MAEHSTKKPRRLGRGLSSLISEPVNTGAGAVQSVQATERSEDTTSDGALRSIPVGSIAPARHQPRQSFDDVALDGLAASIRTSGVMQPIAVRPIDRAAGAPAGVRWELIAGERRWRAAQRAGLDTVPAIVSDLTDKDAAEWSLVENLQREDLNPIERAGAFKRLIDDFSMTQAELARRVGLERSTVANLVRLMELEAPIRDEIASGRLSPGHGKALLALTPGKGRITLAIKARDGRWSVRRLESHVQSLLTPASGGRSSGADVSPRDAAMRDLERRLREALGTKVQVRTDASGKKGSVTIRFYDLEQLDGLLSRLGVAPE